MNTVIPQLLIMGMAILYSCKVFSPHIMFIPFDLLKEIHLPECVYTDAINDVGYKGNLKAPNKNGMNNFCWIIPAEANLNIQKK